VDTGDLVTALLHSESDWGEGSYNSFDKWSTSLHGGAGSAGARLVTVHEALHAVLNDTTAFGALLAACAVLAKVVGGPYKLALKTLVEQCRGVHEAFATFQSLWLVVAGDTSYLSGYPRYLRWYKDASELVPVPDHMRRKEMMLEAAARVCMQAPVLTRLTGETAVIADALPPPAGERPDERFALLHRVADAKFWARAWDQCAVAVSDTPLWEALEASDHDVALRPETYDDAFSEPLATCAHLLYSAVAALLAEHGLATLEYDGHRDPLTDVIAFVEREAPAARGMLLDSSDERGVQEETFELWRRERLVVRERPRPAVVRRFNDVLQDRQIAVLLSGEGERMHVFASVRPTHRLLEQFAVGDADASWLGSRGSAPVVTIRSDNADQVELTVVDEPAQLSRLAAVLPAPLVIYANVSLACLGDLTWRRHWSRALHRARLTGLFDLSPMAQVNLWRNEHQKLRYAQATIRDGNGEPADLMVWMVGDTNLPLLLVCTSVTSDILRQYIESVYPDARLDADIIGRRQGEIELTTSHLLQEEYFFDLSAYPELATNHQGIRSDRTGRSPATKVGSSGPGRQHSRRDRADGKQRGP
jgi:hypothetical protein